MLAITSSMVEDAVAVVRSQVFKDLDGVGTKLEQLYARVDDAAHARESEVQAVVRRESE